MRKSENRDSKRLRKILQYFMMLLLLTAAFVLPKYGMMKQEMKNDTEIQQEIQQESQHENQDVNREMPQEISRSRGTIVLDPGHGGRDGGMTGSSGVPEKVLNLVYAQKLAVLLEQEGYRVILTRNTDAGLYDETASHKKSQDMQRRCALIEAEQPLLTVSIHQNSYPQDSSVRGPQVFYYEHSAEGEQLAACIQKEMNEQLGIEKPRAPKANGNYYILKRSASMTVLVEVGFLTNPQEEMLLQQEDYQEKTVRAICDGIREYLDG